MQLFIDSFTVLDFSFLCAHRGIVGESWYVDVTLSGTLDDQNMILDFGQVKSKIKAIIDEDVDHRLLVPMHTTYFKKVEQDPNVTLIAETASGLLYLNCPKQAYVWIDTPHITQETVARYLEEILIARLPHNIKQIHIELRSEKHDHAFYHYSHGLKKHDGNCQRIAHGHRSQLKIFKNNQRAEDIESKWAQDWQDIYLGSITDQVSVTKLNIDHQIAIKDATHYAFSYKAQQGIFQIALPKQNCRLIPYDTTVELLAQFIAQQLKTQYSQDLIKVVAYEGINKGAIAYAS
tara:strand:+ start:2586 stop:3458 length:873 start_codon:yes stop_codon:yes gene_type:complete